MKKWLFISFVSLLVFCTIIIFIKKNQTGNLKETVKDSSFFIPVPITKFSKTDSPCINVRVGNETFSFDIDLGFQGDLSISSQLFDQISEKTFIGTNPLYGFRGEEYVNNLYSIPEINIGSLTVFKPVVHETHEEFYKKAVIVKNNGQSSPGESGRLGWEFFYNFNLLLDCNKSVIAFCDSVESLKTQGYPIETYAKVPLSLEKGVIEFPMETEKGIMLCILDTGCTFNILNREIEEREEDLLFDPKYQIPFRILKAGNFDLGPVIFRPIQMKISHSCRSNIRHGIIKRHTIFIDFQNRMVYISPKNRFLYWISSFKKWLSSSLKSTSPQKAVNA